MSSVAYGHNIMCPGKPDKLECATCTDRKLRIKGHLPDRWHDDDTSGESIKTFYVTPPCMDPRTLVKQEVRVSEVIPTARAKPGNMRMTVLSKLVEAPR